MRPRALWDAPHQLLHERLEPRPHVLEAEARPHQPHAAVDVEPDAARRDHAVGLVHGRDAADGEAVAPVDVRHRDAGGDHARQRRHVGDLLQRLLVTGLLEQARVGVHAPGDAHGGLGRDLVRELGCPLDPHGPPVFSWAPGNPRAGPA